MEKKKPNGWKIAFFILLALGIVFLAWLFWDGGGEYGYEDSYYYGRESRKETESSGRNDSSGTQEFTVDDVVRDKLVTLKGNGQDTVTVLVYMNGSDLETDDAEATTDLSEMVAAGSSDKVNVIVETMGTKRWDSKFGISSQTAQRYKVTGSGLKLVQDRVGNVNCGSASDLTDFIKWGVKNYPADRYILLFWDHGGGPVYGFGYDDKTQNEDSLTIAEMQKALRDAGTVFDFIGMDCCIMSGIEICCAMYDFCDYMILSEDFESGEGWYYTDWLKALYQNSSIPTEELGKKIVDGMVKVNDRQGENAILAVIDESYMKLLYASWIDFAYANEKELLGVNYSRAKARKAGYRVSPILERKGFFTARDRGFWDWFDEGDEEDVDMQEYYVTDLMAVAQNINSAESKTLSAALNAALVYVNSCGESSNLTGFSVTLPYGDDDFYNEMSEVFLSCGFDKEYVQWLKNFTSVEGNSYYDYDDWDDDWNGWGDYEDDYDWDDWGDDWGHAHDDYDDWEDWWDWGWSDWWY